ncbi:unnamed protein product [[Candida] boidinii]|nr:unnamed protein product [[Candida] boidinii]
MNELENSKEQLTIFEGIAIKSVKDKPLYKVGKPSFCDILTNPLKVPVNFDSFTHEFEIQNSFVIVVAVAVVDDSDTEDADEDFIKSEVFLFVSEFIVFFWEGLSTEESAQFNLAADGSSQKGTLQHWSPFCK